MIAYKMSGLDIVFTFWLISVLICIVIGAIFGWMLFAKRYVDILDLEYEEGYIAGYRKAYEEIGWCNHVENERERRNRSFKTDKSK